MAKKTTENLPAVWDEKLAKYATAAAEAEKGSAGNFFGLKGGILTFDGTPIPNNRMCVVILDSIHENVYFPDAFDPDNPSAPKCYAFSRSEETLAPHASVVERGTAQHPQCNGCKWNAFGTADQGKGKACRNTRRLAMIPAGTYQNDKIKLFTKPEEFTTSGIAYMKLPVTSVREYSAFVKQLSVVLKKPSFVIAAIVAIVPDQKNQFKVTVQAHVELPATLWGTLENRYLEASKGIDFPYPVFTEGPSEPAAKREKKSGRKNRKY